MRSLLSCLLLLKEKPYTQVFTVCLFINSMSQKHRNDRSLIDYLSLYFYTNKDVFVMSLFSVDYIQPESAAKCAQKNDVMPIF